jgi:hypothetical protein
MDEDVQACEEPGEMLAAVEAEECGLRQRPLRLPAGRPSPITTRRTPRRREVARSKSSRFSAATRPTYPTKRFVTTRDQMVRDADD